MFDKRNFLTLVLFLLITISSSLGQAPLNSSASPSSGSEELKKFNKERLNIQVKGMAVLTAWSVGNIIYSSVGFANSDGGANAQFHKMNIMWSGVNLLLSVPGLIGSARGKTDYDLKQSFKQQSGIEKTFIANAALDLAYVAGGLYLVERGKNQTDQSKADMFTGYGNAIIFQGGFLMLFDGVMFAIQNSHGNKKLYKFLENVSLSSNSVGFRHTF